MKAHKIVIIRTDRIGEVLLSTVSVDSLKNSFPDSKISFVTSGYSKPLLENRDDIDNLFVFDVNRDKSIIVKAISLAKILRKERFDIAIVLNPHKALHLGCWLAGIPIRVGYDRKWGFTLNRKMRDARQEGKKHEVEYTLDLLTLIKPDIKKTMPHLSIVEGIEASVRPFFSEETVSLNDKFIAIHPGSSNPVKIWSIENYVDLINKIGKVIDINFVLLGTESERYLTASIMDRIESKVLDLTGKLDIFQLAFVLKQSSIFIGNDNGPMHMAAAVGVPVVAIFKNTQAGTNPARWRPYTEKTVVFHENPQPDPYIYGGLSCDYRRMDKVTADDVMLAVKGLLKDSLGN